MFILIILWATGLSCNSKIIYHTTFKGTIAALRCGIGVVDVNGSPSTAGGKVWNKFRNAISVKNPCVLVDMGLKQGDKILFRIAEDDDNADRGSLGCFFTEYCTVIGPDNSISIYQVKKQ